MNNAAVVAGFVPLVDAAPLIAAHEMSFAANHGLRLRLVRQPSWASLRDHLNLGHLDCAHTLAPLPIATVLGIGQVQVPLIAPLVLSRGGNAITVSAALAQRMRKAAGKSIYGASVSASALRKVIADSSNTLTFGMVHPHSGHNYEIRYWLAAAGIHPDRDVRLVPIPPPLMVESLRAGQVDGFCVGEPWNSVAVHQGFGEIVATKAEIFPHAVEKVLALPATAEQDAGRLDALIACLHDAALWCDVPGNRAVLAELLSRREYLNLPSAMIEQSLAGRIPGVQREPVEDFLYFARYGGGRPRTEEALWLFAQMRRWGQVPDDSRLEASAAGVFRPDLFDAIVPAEPTSGGIRACDGVDFDAADVSVYLERFEISTPYLAAHDSGG